MSLTATVKEFLERHRVIRRPAMDGVAGQEPGVRGAVAAVTQTDCAQSPYPLPAMPVLAREILGLTQEPDARPARLASLVERDPAVAELVAGWARLPLPGQAQEPVASLDQAIAMLGPAAPHITLGFVAGKSLRIPSEGPIGLHACWRHAVYSAALARALAQALPDPRRPEVGLVHLAGLLHNCGFLLLGHLFQPEFYLLNKLVCAKTKTQVTTLERHILCMGRAQRLVGMGHAQMGAGLMRAWNMPEAVTVAVGEHHNADYRGPHRAYAHVVLIADRLLKRCGIGDAADGGLPPQVTAALGLTEERAAQALERVLENGAVLDTLARQAAA
ncbi:MAG: HDOD domain-containing protein [Gammaproteobacteria bacterium]|nr:HDOD domain-containing protein [Gammaproteobacteria bacterium]